MQDRRPPDGRRDPKRFGGNGSPGDARREPRRDPGAYIGRMPERATETIPGGLGPKDERVAAVATQPAPVRGEAPATEEGTPPDGHRAGVNATDDQVHEARSEPLILAALTRLPRSCHRSAPAPDGRSCNSLQ